VEFVRRGYADLDRLLAGLGAQIWQEIPARSGVMKKTLTKKQFCLAIGAKR
jgi:UDP-N-acetylglucosamine 1-carboxyvinyltransferase